MPPKTTLWPLEPHTVGKHEVLRNYLKAWLPIMLSSNDRVLFIDAFAGPGRYLAWISEDVGFYWALRKLAKKTGREVRLIRSPRVRPSSRRFDRWPLWRTLVWTNPLHRGVPALEGGLGRLVHRCRPVDSKRSE